MSARGFYVYTHARPDGSVFYVGKGRNRRAYDFAPARRTAHHLNIVRKYGRDAISVSIFPQESEAVAFESERALIAILKTAGIGLINLTAGGEGAAGRPQSPAQMAAFSRGRGKDRKLSEESKQRIADACRRGNQVAGAWRNSEEGRVHIKALGKMSAAATAAREKRALICGDCGNEFHTVSLKAKFCSKACQQRARRRIEKLASPARPKAMRPDNTSGVTGVYWNKRTSVWVAFIGTGGALKYLGRFKDKESAIAARKAAESMAV